MKTTQSEKILLKKFKYAGREGFVLNGYGFYYSSGRNSTIDNALLPFLGISEIDIGFGGQRFGGSQLGDFQKPPLAVACEGSTFMEEDTADIYFKSHPLIKDMMKPKSGEKMFRFGNLECMLISLALNPGGWEPDSKEPKPLLMQAKKYLTDNYQEIIDFIRDKYTVETSPSIFLQAHQDTEKYLKEIKKFNQELKITHTEEKFPGDAEVRERLNQMLAEYEAVKYSNIKLDFVVTEIDEEALSTLKKGLGDIFAKVKVKDHSLTVYLHKGPEHDIAKLNIVKTAVDYFTSQSTETKPIAFTINGEEKAINTVNILKAHLQQYRRHLISRSSKLQEKFLNNGELRHSEEKKSIPSKEEKHSFKSVKVADQYEHAEKWARILIERLEEKNTPATFKLCTFNKLFQQCKNEMQYDQAKTGFLGSKTSTKIKIENLMSQVFPENSQTFALDKTLSMQSST